MDVTLDRPPFDTRTLVIMILCLIGAALAATALYNDLTGNHNAAHGTPVGQLEKSESRVRRKLSTSYLWDPVQPNERIYNRDSIQTGPASAAVIRLKNGSLLELGEDSMVQIDELSQLPLNFLRGAAVLRDSKGDRAISVGPGGSTQVRVLSARLEAPVPLARLYVRDGFKRQVRFTWSTKRADLPSLALEVSTDRVFSPGRTGQYPVLADSLSGMTIALPEGTYFWRLASAEAPATETRKFSIDAAEALRPIRPGPSQLVISPQSGNPIPFHWASGRIGRGAETGHWLEISRDASFQDMEASISIHAEDHVRAVQNLADGDYFWRIRSVYPDLSLTSEALPFRVRGAVSLEVPLLAPDSGASLSSAAPVRFDWKLEGVECEFQFELEGPSAQSLRQGKQFFLWKNPSPGAYRWRVQALAGQRAIGSSAWRALTIFDGKPIKPSSPAFGRDIRYWNDPTPFFFSWESDALVERPEVSYQLEIATDPDFKRSLIRQKSKMPSIGSEIFKLPPGSYFWRVSLVDSAGHLLKPGDPSRFNYGPFPPLGAPTGLSPRDGGVFKLNQTDRDPVVSWAPLQDATSYLVTLSDGRRTILRLRTAKTGVALSRLAPGRYLWSVRPVDRIGRLGNSSQPMVLIISPGDLLPPPVVVRSKVGE